MTAKSMQNSRKEIKTKNGLHQYYNWKQIIPQGHKSFHFICHFFPAGENNFVSVTAFYDTQ